MTPRLVLVAGTTRTAEISGISAAGSDPAVMAHTPSVDAELVAYGRPLGAGVVPVSPTGCPTPALVTRTVRELVGFEMTVIDAGLARPTGAPTVSVGANPGADVRDPDPVPSAAAAFDAARAFGRALPAVDLLVAETIPGGTTTALGVLTALGEPVGVSSSLPDNPIDRKRAVVESALESSGLEPGGAAGDPVAAARRVGDPVLPTVAGLTIGAVESGASVTLAGGTQLVAAAAMIRHTGFVEPLPLSTTSFVADDPAVDLTAVATRFDLDVTVTDPGFDSTVHRDHPAFAGYLRGEAKEGVGMGGALALAERSGVPMDRLHTRIVSAYDRLLTDHET